MGEIGVRRLSGLRGLRGLRGVTGLKGLGGVEGQRASCSPSSGSTNLEIAVQYMVNVREGRATVTMCRNLLDFIRRSEDKS